MDHVGKVRAVTTLSPVRADRLRQLRQRLRMVRYTPGIGRPLVDLGIIHYARWSIVDALPAPDGAGGWRGLRSKYLLFESNYDGVKEADYLDTFSDVVPERIAAVWGACVGFEDRVLRAPRAAGRIIPAPAFRGFIGLNRLDVLGFHVAFPEATAGEIRQAIALADRSERRSEADDSDYAEARRADAVLMATGPASPPQPLRSRARELYDAWRRAVRGHYGVKPLSIVVPLTDPAAIDAVRSALPGVLTPALRGTETHFARVSLLPPWLTDVGQRHPDRLDTAYLLFSSDFWGDRFRYLEQLRERLDGAAGELRECVAGFPDTSDQLAFHAWIERHAIRTDYYVAGYPPRSVGSVGRLVEERRALAAEYAEPAGSPLVGGGRPA